MSRYTWKEIEQALDRLAASPDLALEFLASAQNGNQDDLAFLDEAQVDIFVSGGKVTILRKGQPWTPGGGR